MSLAATPFSSFDVLDDEPGDQLLHAAADAAKSVMNRDDLGVLVVVVRPDEDQRVISGGGTGVLRAAVSVAVAADHHGLWSAAPAGDTLASSTHDLPEVVSTAADADGVVAVHTGRVSHDGEDAAVVFWFETIQGVASHEERRRVLADLAHAAATTTRPRRARTPKPEEPTTAGPREFDPTDATLDPATGLLNAGRFEIVAAGFEAPRAGLIVVDLEDRTSPTISDSVARSFADHLVTASGRRDILARLNAGRFVVLAADVPRAEIVERAKKLLTAVCELVDPPTAHVVTTIAVAHEVGWVDVDEMIEWASDAVESGKRHGGGRLVLAN